MSTNNNRLFLLMIVLATGLSGCKVVEYFQQDSFYRNGSEVDHLRFPLVKPYYAIYLSDKNGWVINLEANPPSKELYYYYTLHDVKKIAIEHNIIMVYTPHVEKVDESVGQKVFYWFVFKPDENVEIGFENEEDFLAYIQQYGIQQPSWRLPDDILREYDDTWCLDWIPTCN